VNSRIVELRRAIVLMPGVVAAIAVTIDAVLRKRQVPSIIGWVALA
jgi:hypothetical protein